MSTIWEIAEPQTSALLNLPYSNLFLKILALRGCDTEEKIGRFLYPSLDHLHDPFEMKGIREARKRILKAVESKENIFIHGDYDVDGVTATAILGRTLERLGGRFTTFLPERKRDGYGVSGDAVRLAAQKKASLFVTVDCGITAFEETEAARRAGMDVIIIDHHRIHEGRMPEANVVVNPLQDGCGYPFKELSAGGLVFKLSQSLLGRGAFELLDLAALSSVCDLAPLSGENRVVTRFGLERLAERRHLGLKRLSEAAKISRKRFFASDLGFVLGPRINASGRLGTAENALELLMTNDDRKALELAKVLDAENRLRQKEDRELLRRALQIVERDVNFNRDKVIVVGGEGWHEGVIGIVASRLVERFGRPAVVISFDGEEGKGSCRSVKGFHMFNGLARSDSWLEEFGGHERAAGFRIRKKNLSGFRASLGEFAKSVSSDVFCRSVRIDLEIGLGELTPQFLRELELLEPFGLGNPRPAFLTRGLRVKRLFKDARGFSTRLLLTDGCATFDAVTKLEEISQIIASGETFAAAYSPVLKTRDGIESVVLEVKDLKSDGFV